MYTVLHNIDNIIFASKRSFAEYSTWHRLIWGHEITQSMWGWHDPCDPWCQGVMQMNTPGSRKICSPNLSYAFCHNSLQTSPTGRFFNKIYLRENRWVFINFRKQRQVTTDIVRRLKSSTNLSCISWLTCQADVCYHWQIAINTLSPRYPHFSDWMITSCTCTAANCLPNDPESNIEVSSSCFPGYQWWAGYVQHTNRT